jgi:intergrase/recombinase
MYEAYLNKVYLPIVAKDRLRYAKKYAHCLFNRNFSTLKLLTDSQRVHAMKALSALSKFAGIYETFKGLVKNYGLKWSTKTSSDLIIERLIKTTNPNEIFDWVNQVITTIPELTDFMTLIAITGMRYNETVECYNLIIKLSKEGRLDEYYNSDREILEHYRFKDIFIRNSKKLFLSFIPRELIYRISHNSQIEWNATKKKVSNRVGCLRFADIREFHGSFTTKWLRQPEIDFLHGRCSANVFMINYFNPTWITDLKERTFKAMAAIESSLNS